MKRLLFIFLILAALPALADVDTKDGTAITSTTNIDGFSSNIDDYDGQVVKAAAGGGLTVTNLTSGNSGSEATTIACNTMSPSGMVLVSTAFAYSNTVGASPSMTVSGCGLTWTQIDGQIYASRRVVSVHRGIGTWSAVGNLTLTADDDGSETFQETLYSIEDVSGYDTGTPNDAAVSEAGTAANNDLPSVGTPGAGDMVFSVHTDEDASDSIALTSGITQLTKIENGSNVRSFICGYDDDPADTTPGFTSSTSNGYGGIGFIINTN